MSKNNIPQSDNERVELVVSIVTAWCVTLTTSDVVRLLDKVGCHWSHPTVLRTLEQAANEGRIGYRALSAKDWGWYGLGWSYGGGNL